MNPLKNLLFYFYLLQLENYRLGRFWKLNWNLTPSDPAFKQRQQIVWTAKAKIIFGLAILLALIIAVITCWNFENIYGSKYLCIILEWWLLLRWFPTWFLVFAVAILSPLDWAVKKILVARAAARLKTFPNLKIIGITGSYGKTTMKETLATILSERYQVLKTPENINTPIGIARLILNQLNSQTEILIVEMGAYQRGDIRELCAITPPDVAMLTGINEAHLELFGSIANTIEAKFEIVKYAKPQALVVLNEDNNLVKENYHKYVGNRKALWFKNTHEIPFGLTVPILGRYISSTISACVIIAKELGLSDDQIMRGIGKIKPIPHRLQRIDSGNGVIVIDDSYNGNPAGVREAIEVLGSFQKERKVYITPGLVEMGEATESVHQEVGRQLAKVADLVILIKNSVTPYIAAGLTAHGFDSSKIIWFDSALKAHADLGQIIKAGDVVMFQNDWPDNYL